MSDERDMRSEGERLDAQQRLAREAVRSLPRPQASAEFRARLKRQFVAGEIPETPLKDAVPELEAPQAPIRAETQRLGRLWLGWTALAAAAVLAVAVLGLNRLPGPRLLATHGTGTVTIAGETFATGDAEALGEALRPGARIVVGEGVQMDVVYPGSFVLRAEAGTDLVLPDRPGRWFRRAVEAPMEYGELSIRTGPQLAGGSLIIRTAESRTAIYGTLVSVMRNEELNCICLYEGSAEVLPTGAETLGAVPVGMRWVVFSDDREPQLMDIMGPHVDHMLEMDDSCANIFELPETD